MLERSVPIDDSSVSDRNAMVGTSAPFESSPVSHHTAYRYATMTNIGSHASNWTPQHASSANRSFIF